MNGRGQVLQRIRKVEKLVPRRDWGTFQLVRYGEENLREIVQKSEPGINQTAFGLEESVPKRLVAPSRGFSRGGR